MAYRSSGADNNGMVSNLKRFGIISSLSVEEGFRQVDRKFFVPKGAIRMAHMDEPIKEGNIHISAPHIYGVVVEALELPSNSSMTFLNAGSGTGYLTCIAASIMGPSSSHYCIEIHPDAIEHCKQAIADWKVDCLAAQDIEHIEIFHGNAFELDTQIGECALGFDRIYVGAAIETLQLEHFKRLLKPGGILIVPVDDELMKIVRIQSSTEGEYDFREEILSAVRFAPLLSYPHMKTTIPARVWSPELHPFYPENFRNSCRTLLMCSHAAHEQPIPIQPPPTRKVNVAATLPRALWMEIFSYTHKDWYEAPISEVEILKRRLKEETEKAELANKARLEADARCHMAERERDVYRLLALRAHRIEGDVDIDALEAIRVVLLADGNLPTRDIRRFLLGRRSGNNDQDLEYAESDSDGSDNDSSDSDPMDEDDEDMDSSSEGSLLSRDSIARNENVQSNDVVGARQVRTVSIAGEDI